MDGTRGERDGGVASPEKTRENAKGSTTRKPSVGWSWCGLGVVLVLARILGPPQSRGRSAHCPGPCVAARLSRRRSAVGQHCYGYSPRVSRHGQQDSTQIGHESRRLVPCCPAARLPCRGADQGTVRSLIRWHMEMCSGRRAVCSLRLRASRPAGPLIGRPPMLPQTEVAQSGGGVGGG